MKPTKLFVIVVVVLLAAGLAAAGWLVLNPVQPWPSIEGINEMGTEASMA